MTTEELYDDIEQYILSDHIYTKKECKELSLQAIEQFKKEAIEEYKRENATFLSCQK